MPTVKKFSIKNFRGIQSAEINLNSRHRSSVITLIGLNESGKTTVLEALSHFSTGDRTVPNLLSAIKGPEHLLSLIPLEDKPAFSGSIVISANIKLDEADKNKYLEKAKSKFGVDIRYAENCENITISREYEFKDSKLLKTHNLWDGVSIETRTGRSKKFIPYEAGSGKDNIWLYFVDSIEEDIFEIVYFPTFLVDFPSKIYLQAFEGESDVNVYYRSIFGHVIKYADPRLNIDQHIIRRVQDFKSKSKSQNWISELYSSPEKGIIDSVISKIEAALNKEILGSWAKIFKDRNRSRSIKAEWSVDAHRGDIVYISLYVSDGRARYAIDERSLGFRWFFSYLLFTQFRSNAGRPALFLFDEPAANLHAKAQVELLNSMKKIVSNEHRIIYSTHSPHMINPLWLDGAYIVENRAVNFDDGEDVYGFDVKPTDISITRYPEFLSKYPEKDSYFQPVMEKLLYATPPIIGDGPYCLVEGISDYHAFMYARGSKPTTDGELTFDIMPGLGAGAFDASITALIASGEKFLVVLDDDEQGGKEKRRYLEEGILNDSQIFTYADFLPALSRLKLEEIILRDSRDIITAKFDGKSSKKHIRAHLAEIASTGKEGGLHAETIGILNSILLGIGSKLRE